MYGYGLRIFEVIALDSTDIDLTRRTLHIRDSKGGQDRLLPVMETALAIVKDYHSLRRTLIKGPDHGALFLNQYGKRMSMNTVYTFFDDLNAARGPEARHLHPRLFRHSIAVHLLRG
jgi:integrase/recombinase XerD